MAISKVGICNSALTKVGSARITSLSDETEAAEVCNDRFDTLRDEVLMAHPWNFATKRASLAQLDETPEFEYDYAFQLPTDCLRVLNTRYSDEDYKIEGRKLLSSTSKIKIKYVYQNTNYSEYPPLVAEAIAYRLAVDLAYRLTNSNTLAERLHKEYLKKLAEARSMDGQEGSIQALEADDWITARY